MALDTREQIAEHYGLGPFVAHQLVGDSPAEWIADAAARAAIASMFRTPTLEEAERSLEPEAPVGPNLPPGDKQFEDYTPEDWKATEEHYRLHAEHRSEMARQREQLDNTDPSLRAVRLRQSKGQALVDALHRSDPEDDS